MSMKIGSCLSWTLRGLSVVLCHACIRCPLATLRRLPSLHIEFIPFPPIPPAPSLIASLLLPAHESHR
jgi:hypothetical protein